MRKTIFLVLSSYVFGTTLYVSPGGSDNNDGTNSSPFATIQKGINTSLNGDTIQVAPGTVWGEADLGVHHLGYWTNNLEEDHKRLTDQGYVWEATYLNPETEGPYGFTYHTLNESRLRVELVDIGRKPAFDRWMEGGDFPTAMEPGGMEN